MHIWQFLTIALEKQQARYSVQHEGHFWATAFRSCSVASRGERTNGASETNRIGDYALPNCPFRGSLVFILEPGSQTCFSGTFNTEE